MKSWKGEGDFSVTFVPLVENVFKYIGGEYCIALGMRMEDHELHFNIENTVFGTPMPQQKRQGIDFEAPIGIALSQSLHFKY